MNLSGYSNAISKQTIMKKETTEGERLLPFYVSKRGLIMKSESFLTENVVVEVLRNEYDTWVNGLSPEERHAIRKYSYNSHDKRPNRFFERLNARLRGVYNKDDAKMLDEYGETISKTLKRQPSKSQFICYRSMDVNPVESLKIGTEFQLKQFISTSVIRSKAFEGDYHFIIYVYPGASGAYIEKVSAFPSQREFLLDKDCWYKLLSDKENIIELEVRT